MAALLLYDIHGKTFSGRSSEFSLVILSEIRSSRRTGEVKDLVTILICGRQPLNQQQLQIARAALWHQNGTPLDTHDAAASWLDEMGFCLFLPRHAQFPAPAPSLVEACIGSANATPAPAAISTAMELTTRLVEAGQAIPLNLLGTFAEQPDFLIASEVLPWVAAIRGDRHWKIGPGGRTAPIVVRTWEALEQRGGQTAAELREALGREVTEAAVLRALIELWTTLRAMPVYAAGEATRWHLLKERHAPQLATGANTAQATALSAVISLYLRSAVAATAEEVEIYLSPLTARSRIREVLHGMMATRQLGTMSVASQTLLFVEGSLPEVAPVAEPEAQPVAAAPERRGRRDEERPKRRPERQDRERRDKRPPHFAREDRGRRFERPQRREFRPAAREDRERKPGRAFEKGREKGREGKPWQKRTDGSQQREGRPPFRKPFGKREQGAGEKQERPPFRKPFDKREQGAGEKPERPPFRKPFRGERQPEQQRPRFGKGPRPQFGKRFEGQPPRRERDREGRPQRPGQKFAGPSRFERGDRPERREFRKGFGGRGPGRVERPEQGGRPDRENRGGFRPEKRGRGPSDASSRPRKPRPRRSGEQKPRQEEGSE